MPVDECVAGGVVVRQGGGRRWLLRGLVVWQILGRQSQSNHLIVGQILQKFTQQLLKNRVDVKPDEFKDYLLYEQKQTVLQFYCFFLSTWRLTMLSYLKKKLRFHPAIEDTLRLPRSWLILLNQG